MDWKWAIGLLLGIVGIVAPIAWTVLKDNEDRNGRISNAISQVDGLEKKINVMTNIAAGQIQIPSPFVSQVEVKNAMDDMYSHLEALGIEAQVSAALTKQLSETKRQTNHFIDDLSYCQFVDDASVETLPLLRRELAWLSGILEIEKNTFWEALLGTSETRGQYANLARALRLERYDERIASGGLISGFNGCCSAYLETLEGDEYRDLAIATRMCSI